MVQEQRFRLVQDDGRALLLTLAHDAPLDADTLSRLHAAGTPVRVEYAGQSNLTSGVAHNVLRV
jgi:hypothetical protein